MQRRIGEIREAGGEVVALSARGDRRDVERVRNELEISFGLVPAPIRQAAEAYGVWNQQRNSAFGTVIIDKSAKISFFRFGRDEHDRPSLLEILTALRTMK